jgi:hypothetical protein
MHLCDFIHIIRLDVYYEYNRFSSVITQLNAQIHHTSDINGFSVHLFIY